MLAVRLALLLGALSAVRAAEESCEGRCDQGFDAQRKCQCDDLCSYYQSCCSDYAITCRAKVARGDAFSMSDDDYVDYYYNELNATTPEPVTSTLEPETHYVYSWMETTVAAETTGATEEPLAPESQDPGDGEEPLAPESQDPGDGEEALAPEYQDPRDEEEALCSGKPFDAFTSAKNGSIYAFRGKYFYELDEKSVRPGYPKLIRDVWGIEGPVDAAFTRINCEGKTYLFQGSLYWRFDDGVMEPDFPRNISDGFQGIPDDLDAAFAVPAENYISNERVYFFKGKKYWSYDFSKQPSREDCEATSPSVVFDHYVLLHDEEFDEFFQLLFGGTRRSGASPPRYISRDWHGVPADLDAAMLGRLYVAQSKAKPRAGRKMSRRRRRKYRRRQRWGRWNPLWAWGKEDSSESSDLDWPPRGGGSCQPFQSVYFFVQDKYYRLNLQTRRVDWVYPRYPRPIAKYWLGCPSQEDHA